MSFRSSLSLVALVGVLAAACAKDPNAPDATTPLTGHWVSSDTVEVFTSFDVHMAQNPNGIIGGNWVGTTRIKNGKCDAEFGCAPRNVVSGSNLSLRVDLDILGAGSFSGQLATKDRIEGKIIRFGVKYGLTLRRVD